MIPEPASGAIAPGGAPRGAGGRRWVVVGLAALLFICSQFYRVAVAVVAPQLQRDLGLSSEALGGVSAAFFYAFAAAQVPLALFLDRLGARRTMTALTLVGAAGAVVFATAGGRADATVGRALLGLGMAGNLMGSLKLVSRWFSPREFATIGGALTGVGTLGNVLATTPLALLVDAVGWRRSFALVAAVTAALAVLFWLLVREAPEGAAPEDAGEASLSIREAAGTLLRSRDYWLVSFGAFCRYGTFVAIQGLWAGPWLVEVVGLGPIAAASLLLLLNVAFAFGAPLGGWLSDRVLSSRKRVGLLALAGLAAAELMLAAGGRGSSPLAVAAVLALLGVASSFGQVVYPHIKELMPARMAGMAMTGVNLFVMLGAATFLHGMGWMLDHGAAPGRRGEVEFRAAFLVAAAASVAALFLYSLTRERRLGRADAGAAPAEVPCSGRS